LPVYIDAIPKADQVQRASRNARQLILQDHWTMARTAQPQFYEVVVVKNTLQTTLGRLPTMMEISDKFHRNMGASGLTSWLKCDFRSTFARW
jgi:hypothetical protein